MTSNTYDVIVETPMGDKEGQTTLNIDNGVVSGTLTLLGKTNEFADGSIDAAGNVEFSGKMHTPFGKMPFNLKGTLIDGKIEALTTSKIGNFKIHSK